METLNDQIGILSNQVEALSTIVEQLDQRITGMASQCRLGPDQLPHPESHSGRHSYSLYSGQSVQHGGLEAAFEHKDILVDSNGFDAISHTSDRPLTPEIQIQRLTAQLTAAYHRIAALEEQLLNKRVHHQV